MKTHAAQIFKARLIIGLLTGLSLTAMSTGRVAAQSVEPPSLTGEFLVFPGNTPPTFGSSTCNPVGVSEGRIRVEGVALGPYSGTYQEEARGSFFGAGIPEIPIQNLPVLAFEASFEIDSPVGRVTGTKTLLFGVGTCFFSPLIGEVWAVTATVDYEATIATAFGTFRDTGVSEVSFTLLNCAGGGDCRAFFVESFFSSGLLALDTTGKATGGGQLGDLLSGDLVSFGFEVKQPELGKLQGRCVVNDSEASTKIKCLDVTSYSQIGNTATWTGRAEVNGAIEDYRITVQDNGEPNQGIDTFSIVTQSYEAASNVEHGNVQLHKQKSVP